MTHKFLIAAALAGLAVTGCDSSVQQTVTRGLPVASTVNAVENITTASGSTTITFAFPQAALPQAVVTGSHPKVVLGGRPAALMTGPSGTLIASLPPQTPPPTPDLNGNTVLLFQSDAGSQLVEVHLTVNRS
ncbi:MAG TPA: hypothetical protein V6D05_07530 [Stenomitos sp.]